LIEVCDFQGFGIGAADQRQGVTYAQLAELIGDKEPNVRNKLSRGKFSAAFMIQSLAAIGIDDLRL
jgi:hypothetical protein